MTIDQRARESAAAVRAARSEARLTATPPGGGPRRRSRVALAAAGALAVLLLVGVPAAVLLTDRGLDTLEGTVPAGAAQPGEQPAADPTRAARLPTEAELDTGIRYLRSYAISTQEGLRFHFATEQWLHPDGRSVARAAASPPLPDGELAVDVAAGNALLDSVEPIGDRIEAGVTSFGFGDRHLPATPAELEAALTAGPFQGGPLFSPGEALTPDGSGLDRRGLILRTVPSAMSAVLDPDVAGAFYELVAGLEGAVVTADATDPLGRPSIEVAVPVPMFDDNGVEVGRLAYVTWFDTDTKLVTGQRSELEAGSFPFSGDEGTIARLFVIADRGVVDEMPPVPKPAAEPRSRPESSPSTTVAGLGGAQFVGPDGSAFASSQIDALHPDLIGLAGGNLECPGDCAAIDGPRSVHLTIDPILQSELEPYMTADAFAGRDGAAAVVMVMDAETGAVLGLAGDADAAERGLVETAFDTRSPPHTVLLPIVLALAIDDGMGADAVISPAGECGPAPDITVIDALAAASEPALCQLWAELGPDRVAQALNGNLQLPGGELRSVADVAALFAVVENGGRRAAPHLVERIAGGAGEPLGEQRSGDHAVLDPASAAAVAAALDGLPGYAAGTWHAGSAGGVTVVVWDESGAGPAGDVWATAMELSGTFG